MISAAVHTTSKLTLAGCHGLIVASHERGERIFIPDDSDTFPEVVAPVLTGMGADSPPREITILDSRVFAYPNRS